MTPLEQALAELPGTAEEIAAYLIEQECRGITDDPTCCPVANFLKGKGFPEAWVDLAQIKAAEDGPLIDSPPGVAEFVDRFDSGEWPELDTEDVTE